MIPLAYRRDRSSLRLELKVSQVCSALSNFKLVFETESVCIDPIEEGGDD